MTGSTTAADDAWGPVPSGERWSSGRWALDVRGDELADIRCDDVIVVRGVRMVSRDVDWRTAWPLETAARVRDDELVLELVIDTLGIDLVATVRVRTIDEALEISVDAVARSDSWTNRTGLVLLHPPRLAGEKLLVAHTDGTEESLRFPASISPRQPAREIASLTWSDGDELFRADLDGDVFEMEDQRNWSDASFKTYNRSLDEPFPYRLAAGEHIRQRITLTALEKPTPLTMTPATAFPTIAVGASTAPDPAPPLDDPVTAHRHVELELTDPAWPAALQRARRGARDLSVLLVSPSPADPELLDRFVRDVGESDLRWVAVVDAVTHVSEPELVEALRSALPEDTPVVGGSRAHFTELNREWDRIPRHRLEGLVFPITPLFHTLETEQLVESITMQRLIAEEVTSRSPGADIHIGPITVRPRFDNVATTAPPAPTRADLTEGYGAERTGQSDPRQASAALAAWTIASAAALAVRGVASLTYFEEWGPRGIRSSDGTDLPVRAALDALTSLEGGTLLSAPSPDGQVWAIGARWEESEREEGERQEILVANLSGTRRTIELRAGHRPPTRIELGAFAWGRVRTSDARQSIA